MAPSAKLSVLSEITKAPVRAAAFPLRSSMLFNTTSRGVTVASKFVGFSISGSSSSTTVGAVDTLVLADGTITDLVVKLTAPPGVGNLVSVVLLVNGVASALVADIADNDEVGIGTGSVSVVAGDLLACEVAFAGIASATIRSIGAVVTNSRETWNPASGNGGVGSASIDSATLQAVNLTRIGFKATTPPGATSMDIQVGGVTVESVPVTGATDTESANIDVDVAAGTTEVLLLANTVDLSGPGRMTTTYQNEVEFATLPLLAHEALYQWSLTQDPKFAPWDGSIPVTSEAGQQGAWPMSGTITSAALYVSQFTSTNGGLDDVNVQYVFNINGVGTAIDHTFQKLSADRFQLLTPLSIHINQGDLVSRVATPDNLNALNFRLRMLVTFVPD